MESHLTNHDVNLRDSLEAALRRARNLRAILHSITRRVLDDLNPVRLSPDIRVVVECHGRAIVDGGVVCPDEIFPRRILRPFQTAKQCQ